MIVLQQAYYGDGLDGRCLSTNWGPMASTLWAGTQRESELHSSLPHLSSFGFMSVLTADVGFTSGVGV